LKPSRILTGLFALAFAAPVTAQVKFTATPVFQGSTTAIGQTIKYPQTDSAEVTALRVDVGPGGETGRHMHPYPTFVYILEGSIDVEAEGGATHSYKAGDSFLEAINTWHNGKNHWSTTVKILVVFAGVHGKPNLVRP